MKHFLSAEIIARLFRQTVVFLKKYNRNYSDLGRLIVRVSEHGFI